MKKRLCVLALAGVMAAAFMGCGSSTSGTTAEKAAAQPDLIEKKSEDVAPSTKPEVVPVTTEAKETGGDGEMISGGWEQASSMKVTDEHKELFKKAQETLAGATYTPLAFLGSQVVAGTNYRFLCKMEASRYMQW